MPNGFLVVAVVAAAQAEQPTHAHHGAGKMRDMGQASIRRRSSQHPACVTPRNATAEIPIRRLIARALRDEVSRGCLKPYRVHIGRVWDRRNVIDARKYGPGRNYTAQLLNSKVVVTCNPNYHEGDSRLPEALASGALVIADTMADRPPGLVNGENIVLFSTIYELVQKMVTILRGVALAKKEVVARATSIARAGRNHPRNPTQLVEGILYEIGLLPQQGSPPVRIDFPMVPVKHRVNEFLFTLEGIRRSSFARLATDASDADVVIMDIHRLKLSYGNNEAALRKIQSWLEAWPPSLTVVILDWADGYKLQFACPRVNHYFKRSLGVRDPVKNTSYVKTNLQIGPAYGSGNNLKYHIWPPTPGIPDIMRNVSYRTMGHTVSYSKLHRLYYPAKWGFFEGLDSVTREHGWEGRPWQEREFDASVLFEDEDTPQEIATRGVEQRRAQKLLQQANASVKPAVAPNKYMDAPHRQSTNRQP
jgi:hypothetical protein